MTDLPLITLTPEEWRWAEGANRWDDPADSASLIGQLVAEVRAQAQRAERLRKALEEVAHHADDECGFMTLVREALAPPQGDVCPKAPFGKGKHVYASAAPIGKGTCVYCFKPEPPQGGEQ